jgi:murein DD-endopeptidase MepM/ murein hydrolase activator NlpD
LRRRLRLLLLLAPALGPAAAAADDFQLQAPVNCRNGIDCFVQNYVDVDAGPGARDFTCGPLTYDGHTGTDIRLATRAEMAAGVAVLAVAPGRVIHSRDGMPDIGLGAAGADAADPRACGNGVWLAHADGWLTQYCHMKLGSIAVRRGDAVAAGQKLGEIGLSGRTEFPHLHLNLLHDRKIVDPYSGRTPGSGCGVAGARPLWSAEAAARLGYRQSALLLAGFAAREPDRASVEDGGLNDTALNAGAPMLVFWIEAFGLRQGDVESMRLLAPDGRVLARIAGQPLDGHRAIQFRFVGKRRGAAPWSPGRYVGEYRLRRAEGGASVEALRGVRMLEVR